MSNAPLAPFEPFSVVIVRVSSLVPVTDLIPTAFVGFMARRHGTGNGRWFSFQQPSRYARGAVQVNSVSDQCWELASPPQLATMGDIARLPNTDRQYRSTSRMNA
jgi:hypothetical protein